MATQLSIIRGDTFPTQTITVTSDSLDFTNITCTGQIRPHPDGNLLYQFVPTIISGVNGTGVVEFNFPASVTRGFPPINLYGDKLDLKSFSNAWLDRETRRIVLLCSLDCTSLIP